MPGILEDLGIINNGKLSKNTYAGFIADVRRRLRTGIGIIKYPDVGVPTSPIDLQELAQIENKLLFPEFHSIWRERYEKMAQQLNVPGGFGLAPKPPFLIDPVALAKALGAKELPEVKFPDILFEIQGLPPPDGPPIKPPTIQDVINDPVSVKSIDFFDRYLSDLDPLDPAVPANLMKVIGALPVPITPAFPNPILLKYGYTQRYAFENKVYNSHRSTHTSMMSQAITLIPNTVIELASGTGCYSLMKATRETALLSQPKPMSTSAFEIAAQEILLQHQIKLESAVILGQMLGSGAILQAVAATPEETGGLGLINASATQQNGTSSSNEQSTISNSNNSNVSKGGGSGSSISSQSKQTQSFQQTDTTFNNEATGESSTQFSDSDESDSSSTSQQPQGFGFDQDQPDSSSSSYYDPEKDQPEDQPPAGYGFSTVADDSVPSNAESENDLYPAKENSEGTSSNVPQEDQQPTGFGFGPPPDDTTPVSGGGQTIAEEEPLADNYPPEGSGAGLQTYPPGFGDTPSDVNQEPTYLQPEPTPEESAGEYFGVSVPSSNDVQSRPANVGPPIDPKTMYIPEPNSVSYDSDDDGVDDFVSGKSSGGSFQKNLSNIRKRIRDLIQGGPTCPAEGGFIGGILGPPPDWSSAATGYATSNATFRGFAAGTPAKEWGKVIPGAQDVIGAGYTTKAELDNYANNPDETNPIQAVATTCTRLPGWLIKNILHNPDDTNTTGRFTIPWDSGSDAITLRNGWPFKAGQTALPNPLVPQSGGLVAPPYIAALLDAWVNIDPTAPNINPNCTVGDPEKKPKYGDIYLIRGKDKMLRHIGAIVAWNVNEGWIGTADLGQGSIQGQRSQGMAYCKRATFVGEGNSIEMPGEIAQNDENNKRILMGWIDMDVFIKKLIAMPGMYENSTKPKWLY